MPKLSERQVRRALARLKLLGLIEDVGWKHLAVSHGRSLQGGLTGDVREVYVRMVRGNVAVDPEGGGGLVAELPARVQKRVSEARTRGGARKGAGRPRRPVLAQERPPSGDELAVFKAVGTPTTLNVRNTHEIVEKKSNRSTEGREETEEREEREEIALLPSEVEHAAAPRTCLEDRVEDLLASGKEDEGSTLAGGAQPVAVSVEAFGKLPPFPGTAVLKPPTIPAPPKLSMDMEVPDMVNLMLDAYCMVMQRELPSEFNPHAGRKVKPPDRKVLENAAGELLQSGLSPLRWCEFSFEAWTKGAAKQSVRPPLRWVYAPLRLETMGDWAKTDFDRRGERVVFTRSMTKLIQTWMRMMEAVTLGKVAVADAEQQFFPNGQYQRLVAKAASEARREQAEIDRKLGQGEYVW
jgi:hypothetical protein